MQPRAFLALLLATLVAVVAAAVVLLSGPENRRAESAGAPAFPALRTAAESAAAVEILARQGTVRLHRDEQGIWRLPDKGGYPADPGTLRALLVAAGRLELAEPRTDNPERLPRLWVEDPTLPEAQSLRLSVRAADGAMLADAIVGRTVNDLVAGQQGGTYLRYPDESQAWLAAGKLSVSPDPLDYLDRGLVTLPADTIHRVTVTRPDGSVILAERDPGEPELAVLEGLPEGQAADPRALRQLANLLNGLTFNDVTRADNLAFPADAIEVVVTSFDGIEVRLELATVEGRPWARLTAVLAEEHTTDPARLTGTQAFVDALAAKTAGWAYELPAAFYARLTPTAESLVSPP